MKKKTYLCAFFSKLERCVAYVGILVCVLQFSACNDVVSPSQESVTITNRPVRRSMAVADFPSTSPEALSGQLQQEPDAICPITAYVVATYELENGKYQMLQRLREGILFDDTQGGEYPNDTSGNHAWHLTEYPRMILDSAGSVKYYEYGLVEDNEITGIITVYAKRVAPCAIAYMFPYILPYEHTGEDYYDLGLYPCRVFNDGIGYRAVEDGEHNPYMPNSYEDIWDEIYHHLTPEEVIEIEDLRTQATIPDVEYETEISAYWDAIDNLWIALDYDLPCVDDGNGGGTPITIAGNTYVQSLQDYLGVSSQCFDYTARPYRSTQLQKTYWDCACGPAALAWIYRGLYNEYPPLSGEYLPIHGDSSGPHFWATNYGTSLYFFGLGFLDNLNGVTCDNVRERYASMSREVDNGLTEVFFNRSFFVWLSGTWQGALPSCRLGDAFSEATNYIYTVDGDCSALTATENIYYNNLPVLILRTGRDHYLIAYGFGGITTSGYNVETKNLYFLIMDNGYTISKNNYKPYWRAYRPCEYYHRIMHN